MHRLKKLLQNLALTAASLLVALALAEALIRMTINVEPSLQIRDPVLGKKFVPEYSDAVWIEESQRVVNLRFNQDGFRGPDYSHTKPDGVSRIAVLGDSMVASVAVDEADTMVGLLEDQLNQASNTTWQVQNYGVAGSGTSQDLLVYRHVASRYQPEVVVLVYFMGNDFADNSPQLSSRRVYFKLGDDDRLEPIPFRAHSSPGSAWLNQHSRFYVWQKTALAKLRGKLGARQDYWIFDSQPDARVEQAWQLNERIITQLSSEVTAAGQRFLMVLYPAGEQVSDEQWQRVIEHLPTLGANEPSQFDPDYPRQRLAGLAQREGIDLLDLTEAFRAHQGPPLYFNGNGHFTEAGNHMAMLDVYA